jgi:hypothetical protein
MAGLWMRMKRLGAALGAASLAACTTTGPAPDAPRPALWKLADEDTTIYLFGTIHLLPKGLAWRTPALERAIAASDTLVLETEIASDEMGAAQTMMKLALSQGLPPLAERVPAEKRAELGRVLKAAGVPEGSLDRMETWAAALTILTLNYKQSGLSAEAGVERGLDESYRGAKRKVIGLETVEQQLGFFDKLSEGAQRALLVSMLDDLEGARAEFQAMLGAWKSGDTDAIARTFDSETALSPELRDVLMTKRNAAWADWLAKRLEQPGTVLVAVGAGHLAGRDSVQRMLSARGLEATRVQ